MQARYLQLHVCSLVRPLLHVDPDLFLQLVHLIDHNVDPRADLVADFSSDASQKRHLLLFELLDDHVNVVFHLKQKVYIVYLAMLCLDSEVFEPVI